MKRLVAISMLAALAACANGTNQQPLSQWDNLVGSQGVAKVSNIKSLEQPGIY